LFALDARLAVLESALGMVVGTAGLTVVALVQAEKDMALVIAHAGEL
jgi:hypothetical protein